jgi:hypothetical protein
MKFVRNLLTALLVALALGLIVARVLNIPPAPKYELATGNPHRPTSAAAPGQCPEGSQGPPQVHAGCLHPPARGTACPYIGAATQLNSDCGPTTTTAQH